MKKKIAQRLWVILGLTCLVSCSKNDSDLSFKPDPLPEDPTAIEFNTQIASVEFKALREPFEVKSASGAEGKVTLEVFRGIPYAVGTEEEEAQIFGKPTRFTHSQMLEFSRLGQTSTFDATAFSDICPQQLSTDTMSETCLTLNIWRPSETEASANLPVYVYIHGGSFETGSGQSPHIIPDMAIAQSVSDAKEGNRSQPFIGITFNYRLGILGSFWLEDTGETKGGNFGIGDQKRALQWIHENIENFGGDPNNITVYGSGAGATSLALLQQEPAADHKISLPEDQSYRFFKRAIFHSFPAGIPIKSYSLANQDNLTTLDILKEKFPGENIEDLSVEDILLLQSEVKGKVVGRFLGLSDQLIADLSSDIKQWIDEGKSTEQILVLIGIKYGTSILAVEPRSKLVPFAPYLEYHEVKEKEDPNCKVFCNTITREYGYNITSQPKDTILKNTAVTGFNERDSDSYTAALKLPFVINIELLPGIKLIDVILALIGADNIPLPSIDGIPDIPAYPLISSILYADRLSDSPLNYEDFKPAIDDSNIDGIKENMEKFNNLNNQLLFKCAVRDFVKNNQRAGVNVSLYHFNFKASFNYVLAGDDIFSTIGNLGCFGGKPCNQTELPFVLNQLDNINGSEISPGEADKALINELSRYWFTDSFFEDSIYSEDEDNILTIQNLNGDYSNKEGEVIINNPYWDELFNKGVDIGNTDSGICDAIY